MAVEEWAVRAKASFARDGTHATDTVVRSIFVFNEDILSRSLSRWAVIVYLGSYPADFFIP